MRPDNNFKYYSYILCYVGDIVLVVHHNAMSILAQINSYVPLKPSSVGEPDIYLGTKLRQTRITNGVWAWRLSPSRYVHQAVKNCVSHLTDKFDGKYRIPKRADNPFPTEYCANTDVAKPLTTEFASFYQHLISVMRWMVEQGCVDIATEVFLLLSYLAYPCEGHLETALHIMGYLKNKHNSCLIFDPAYPDIDMGDFPKYNWTEFYGDVAEAMPTDMPTPLGKDVDLQMMVDSNHAGDKQI
jgi:hypothetical protein